MTFEGSSLWKVRRKVGTNLVLWPGATVLVQGEDGRVLLGLRGDTRDWAMPGGGAEEGSSFAGTAVTELREETGLIAEPADLVSCCAGGRANPRPTARRCSSSSGSISRRCPSR